VNAINLISCKNLHLIDHLSDAIKVWLGPMCTQSVDPLRASIKGDCRVFILTNGCIENRIDCTQLQNYFAKNGWQIAEDYKDADLILFDTCALTQDTANISLRIIKEIKQNMRKGSKLIVCGCLPKIDPELLRTVYETPKFRCEELTSNEKNMIYEYAEKINNVKTHNLLPILPVTKRNEKDFLMRNQGTLAARLLKSAVARIDGHISSRSNIYREGDESNFFIKVSTGCLCSCAYCAIPKSRGVINSKPIEKVVNEFEEGLKKNFKKFSLIGTDVGAYGKDIGHNLVDLLKELVRHEGEYKIGLRNVNPQHLKTMLDEFTSILQSKKIWYMGFAAESGSNRILKLMNRKYTIEEFKECIRKIRLSFPEIIIRTQLMVGFPTETEEDFSKTMSLLDDAIFDYAEVYKYSERSGTRAANIEPKVLEKIKNQRFSKLYRKAFLNRAPRKIKNMIQPKF
jgi:tRNA A37 methylthiotransferase MiaB